MNPLVQDRTRRTPLHLMTGTPGGVPEPRRFGVAEGSGAIRRVAIVEDEMMVAWTIEAMLEDGGYEIAGVFSSGEAALAALGDDAVDLVCMDINLGRGIDGIETAGRIRRAQPAAIIFISAYGDAATATRAREMVPGAVLLGKPVTFEVLEAAIRGLTA